MKNKGVPDKVIMKITGHKSLSSFQRYYRPNDEDVYNFMHKVWDQLRIVLFVIELMN